MKMLAPIGFPEAPSVGTLRVWSVLELEDDDGSRVQVVVGFIKETRLRITSPIERAEGGQVLTSSGSIYTLDGPPATPQDLKEQQTRREALLGGRSAVDVTAQFVGVKAHGVVGASPQAS